ncbi:MAG: TlpA disulfide reductase family protein [Steroidobacteraceae bacterium]
MRRGFAFVGLLVLALMGCAQREQAAAVAPAAAPSADTRFDGVYRTVLHLPAGELPFGLEIGDGHAWLINGAERMQIDDVAIEGDTIAMTMPGYQNRLAAKLDADGLRGSVTLVKLAGEKHVIPLTAARGATHRFFAGGDAVGRPADFSGRWAVEFTNDEGGRYSAVGEFTQQGESIEGTFLTGTGDHRFLAGNVRGRELHLATFDGAHAYLYRAKLDERGKLVGDYWSGLAWHERFAGKRDAKASLGKAESATTLRAGSDSIDFAFPDVDGKVVALHDERFAGKVVVVTLAGSWCPNCHDEAAFLAPYYLAQRGQGLEVVALMFEQFGDLPAATEAVRLFQKQFDIRYPLLIAGIHDTDDATKKVPQLKQVYAFPTTIFIDRKGKVRRIHTGFSGPATGEHYARLKQDFDTTIRQLLSEKS